MIDLVETVAHEVAHFYGMKEYGGAYPFDWLIKDMYVNNKNLDFEWIHLLILTN